MKLGLLVLVWLCLSSPLSAQFERGHLNQVVEAVVYPSNRTLEEARAAGIADAQRDMQAGVFRVYVYDYGDLATSLLYFDPDTGYRVCRITEHDAYGRPGESFKAWLIAYNATVRAWHDSIQ